MTHIVSIISSGFDAGQFAVIIHGHRSELLAHLIAYLALTSIVIWTTVLITIVVRIGAHQRYKSVRHLQRAVKKNNAFSR